MKVLKIALRNQYRAYKQAEALRKKGIDVDLVTASGVDVRDYTFDAYVLGASLYQIPTWTAGPTQIIDSKALDKAIELSKPDVIQYHNPPDYHILDVKRVCRGVPVVIDLADIYSLGLYNTTDIYSGVEHHSLMQADGIINVSKYLERAMLKQYPELKGKLMTTLAGYSLLQQIPEEPIPKLSKRRYDGWRKLNHLVYSGSFWDRNPWRRMGLILSPVSQLPGMRVHIYSRDGAKIIKRRDKNGKFHIKVHDAVKPNALTKELTQYDFGYAGFTDINPLLVGALPNKLFEYYAAGLKICTQSVYTEMANFIKRANCGFTFSDTEDFTQGIEKWRDKDYKINKRYFLDNQINKLIKLFEEVI